MGYEFLVAGVLYQARWVAFGHTKTNKHYAEVVLGKCPRGASVRVLYNPKNPVEAVLETEAKGVTVALVIGLVLSVIGLIIICVFFGSRDDGRNRVGCLLGKLHRPRLD